MKTKVLIAFLLAAYFFVSCNKTTVTFTPNPPRNTFTISGVHDVTMDTTGYAVLALTVAAATGDSNQYVEFRLASGVVRNMLPDFIPNHGTTGFTSSFTFGVNSVYDTIPPGTYPMKVIGESATDTETYAFNLTVPPFNGFTLSGAYMRTASMWHTTNSVSIRSQVYGGTLVGDNPAPWPTADGTYTYVVGAATGKSLNFTYIPKTYATYWTHDQNNFDSVVVIISGGKMSIKSGLLNAHTSAGLNKISINASE
ncbi:MAG: hypothetical protein ABI169_03580 [Chitinophagaceae bacterium]